MTLQSSQVSVAISRLGDAVLDPALWPAIMEDISRAVGATGAALFQSDIRTPDVPHTAGVHDLFQAYFQGNWHVNDIRARGAPLLANGTKLVITDYDSVTVDEMRGTAYYNDLLRPFGFRWFAAIGFHAGPALCVGARNHRRSCSQTERFPARISCQWGAPRAHIICHCARHHRAVLANGGLCSQSLPMGFGCPNSGWLFSITNVSDDPGHAVAESGLWAS
jgi:hypothetical protein